MSNGLDIETVRANAKRLLGAQRQQQRFARDCRTVFGTPEGKNVLAHLANAGFLLQPTAVPGDAEQSLRNEGRRELLLQIIDGLKWSERDVVALAQERSEAAVAGMIGGEG